MMLPRGAAEQRGVHHGRHAREHAEVVRHAGEHFIDVRDVAARVLEADDVVVPREAGHGGGREVRAEHRRLVVEQHRNRTRVGHPLVVGHQHVLRHETRVRRGRAHEHVCGPVVGGPLAGIDRRARRIAARACEQQPSCGHRIACDADDSIRLGRFDKERLAVGAEHQQAAEAGLHERRDRVAQDALVERILGERRGQGREDTAEHGGIVCNAERRTQNAPTSSRRAG